MELAKTLAYYNLTTTITAIKRFIVQTPDVGRWGLSDDTLSDQSCLTDGQFDELFDY
jgi:hypothetical protein